MCAMKRYILQRPVVRKSVSFPGLTKNSNQTSQQLVYTLGNISSIVLSGLLSDDVGAGGAVGVCLPGMVSSGFPKCRWGPKISEKELIVPFIRNKISRDLHKTRLKWDASLIIYTSPSYVRLDYRVRTKLEWPWIWNKQFKALKVLEFVKKCLNAKFSWSKFGKDSQFARTFPLPEEELELRAQVKLKYSRFSVNSRFY